MKLLQNVVFTIGILVTAFWITGRICSDRWAWSQWLAWIPTLVVIATLLLSSTITFKRKRKTYCIVSCVLACLLTLHYLCIEQRFFYQNKCVGDLSIVGWTMSHSKRRVAKESAEIIVELDADITLLTHGWYVRGESIIADWLQPEGRRVVSGPFTLFTKYSPKKVQALVASDGIFISQFILDTKSVLGNDLVVWAIDLPSSLSVSKMNRAKQVLQLIQPQEAVTPDVVIGDFNMTRNSASIKTMFPNMVDAASECGTGLLDTFPMEFPLYHIDHILLAPSTTACSYDCINPHIGRHRIQRATLK